MNREYHPIILIIDKDQLTVEYKSLTHILTKLNQLLENHQEFNGIIPILNKVD
jgi:hypothetical protein